MPEPDPLPPEIAGFKRLRYRLEYRALAAAAWLLPKLPYETLEPLADMFGALVYVFDWRGRGTAEENLKAAFGFQYDADERAHIARQSYQSFARTMLCLFWSPNLTKENYRDYLRIEGLDNHPIHRDQQSPGVYFLFHFSNFEWLSLGSAFAVTPGLVITETLKNPLLGPIFNHLRSLGGHTIIPQSRALIRMVKLLRTGGKVGAASDLSVDPKLGAIPIRCFGLWTAASPMAAILAKRGGARLVPSMILPSEDGKFRILYSPPLELPEDASDQEITQACWDALEPHIRADPGRWLWAYKHWRFKPSIGGEGYPAYANTAKRFDALIQESR